uniref:Uncharacterized protein n=1 Tax=viral metagenome TaxID=1070528 RepID=A0A6C0B463_9ZZZZ
MKLPGELIHIILEFSDVKCCMCFKLLNIMKISSWNNKYIHRKCKDDLELLML